MAHGVLKKLMPVLLFLLFGIYAASQQDSIAHQKQAPAFHVIVNGGVVAGASGRDALVQLVPGVAYKGWFAGVGSGLDYYYWRGVPLFLDVRKVFQTPIPFFLYSDVGWHFPWIEDTYKIDDWYLEDFNKGLYYDVGAGWHVKIRRRHALLLSVGYSGKKVTNIRTLLNIPQEADQRLYTTTYAYDLRRVSIKLGFEF
jgi:hypothetical protein